MHKLVVFTTTIVAALAIVAAAWATPITGKVKGHFQSSSSCLGCGDMVKYIKVDRVWCAWQGSNIIIHVRFRNRSIEHVTIHWHPSYDIAGGGSHGTGLSSVQSSGLNAHASRGVYIKQKPKGVPAGSKIAACKPAFLNVQSG